MNRYTDALRGGSGGRSRAGGRWIAPAFTRAGSAGLHSPLERKNGWKLAERVGNATPHRLQHLLSTHQWDAGLVRDDLEEYVMEHLGLNAAVKLAHERGGNAVNRPAAAVVGTIIGWSIATSTSWHSF